MGRTRRHKGWGRRGIASAVLALGVLAAACGPVDPVPPAPGCPTGPPDAITSTVLNRTNADRQAAGLPALWWNARLACLASEWSQYMASTGQLTHRNLGATIRDPGFQGYASLAENIFVGPGTVDGNAMHGAWMNSPGHHANIMGNYDTIGIGWAKGSDGRIWSTENFGRHF